MGSAVLYTSVAAMGIHSFLGNPAVRGLREANVLWQPTGDDRFPAMQAMMRAQDQRFGCVPLRRICGHVIAARGRAQISRKLARSLELALNNAS
jgi:hypothetical protein